MFPTVIVAKLVSNKACVIFPITLYSFDIKLSLASTTFHSTVNNTCATACIRLPRDNGRSILKRD